LEQFIARENIRRLAEKLGNCTDEQQRATLRELLAAEKRHLARGSFTPRYSAHRLTIE
jgi:hypothetical protein